MGVAGAAPIQAGLLTGLPADTPAAVIQNATLPGQRHTLATLGTLHDAIQREGLASPAVTVVGDVLRGVACVADGAGSAVRVA